MGQQVNQTAASVAAAEEKRDAKILAARDSFPGWEIIETYDGCFAAVPKGTRIIEALDIDHLVRRLRELPDPGL